MRCVLVVYQDLGPAGQSQDTKGLRLDLDRYIEFLLKFLLSASPPPRPFAFHFLSGKFGLGDVVKTDLHNGINPKGYRTGCPEEHHQAGQSIRLLLPPIVPDLWDQLDAPEDSTDGAENVGGDGNFALRCHRSCGEVSSENWNRASRRWYWEEMSKGKQVWKNLHRFVQ